MKKISILIPCYNEEENVGPISEAVVETLERDLPEYDYELVFLSTMIRRTRRARFFGRSAARIHGSRQFLMPKTLDSSIPRIMECYSVPATV